MNKRNVLTVFGIILSFTIAVGGWLATSWLIDIESYRLLSGTRSFVVDIPTIEATSTNDTSGESNIVLGLTENEIVSILWNWELTDNRRPHEPAMGQIDMEQAIMVGRTGLMFLYEHGILPAEMLVVNDIRATLNQNVPQGGAFLPLRYSYWQVDFRNDDIDTSMTINAVTGQVWSVEISSRQSMHPNVSMALNIDLNNIEVILLGFLLNAGIHSSGEFVQRMNAPTPALPQYIAAFHLEDVLVASQSFADGDAKATITPAGGVLSSETLYFTGLIIQLSAN